MDVYRAKWLLPVTADPIENGALAVEGDRIVGVGTPADFPGASPRDLGDSILLPGFVNAHTHLEMTCYHGRVAPAPLWDWFEQVMALRLKPGAVENERRAVHDGAALSVAAGVTCIGDISRTGLHVRALATSPIRKVCFLELISGAHLPPNDIASLTAMADEMATLAEPDRLTIGISPHTLYTVTWDDLVGSARLTADRNLPLTIHVLETTEEAAWLPTGKGRLQTLLEGYKLPTVSACRHGRAVEQLQQAGLLDQRPLLAHVNYIGDDELRDLAASQALVAWCPRSHRFFGHAAHRWRDMLRAGVNVCLATDSLASNDTLSILDEMRHVRRTTPDIDPDIILEMGTIRAAVALRLENRIGSLETGKLADFVTIPWNQGGSETATVNLLDGERCVAETWIGGVSMPRMPHRRSVAPRRM